MIAHSQLIIVGLRNETQPTQKAIALPHGCGYYLASQGHDTRAIQDYLGHKNIHHTVRYTQMSPQRFENFWMD